MWVCFLLSNMIQERTARSIITQGHDMHSRLALHYNIFFITYNMLFPTLLHLFVPTPKDLYFILYKGILRRIQLFTYQLKRLNAAALFFGSSPNVSLTAIAYYLSSIRLIIITIILYTFMKSNLLNGFLLLDVNSTKF